MGPGGSGFPGALGGCALANTMARNRQMEEEQIAGKVLRAKKDPQTLTATEAD
jgi:hypothetical protein